MKFDGDWTCVDALVFIVFGDEPSALRNGEVHTRLSSQFRHALAHGSGRAKPSECEPSHWLKISITIASLKRVMKNIDADAKRHALLWLRWALSDPDLPISREFVRRAVDFCAGSAGPHRAVLQVRRSGGELWRGTKWPRVGDGTARGYLLGDFLKKKFKFDIYAAHVQLQQIDFSVTADKRIRAADSDTSVPPLPALKKKRIGPAVYGTGVKQALEKSLRSASRSPRFNKGLIAFPTPGRYLCSWTRQQLIDMLRKNDDQLSKLKKSTLLRGISDLVQFRRGRPPHIETTK